MSRAAFVAAVGARVAHVTAAENIASIRKHGLLSAAALAERAGVPAGTLRLRTERLKVGLARLNHQRPLQHGIRAANKMLDGHTPESWAAALDRRIFLWPAAQMHAFAASIERDVKTETLWLDAAGLYDACADQIDLSPINSGNFLQGGGRARRGDWLFVPAAGGADAFRLNRVKRGLAKSPDRVREISLRGAIPRDILERLLT